MIFNGPEVAMWKWWHPTPITPGKGRCAWNCASGQLRGRRVCRRLVLLEIQTPLRFTSEEEGTSNASQMERYHVPAFMRLGGAPPAGALLISSTN